MADRDVTDGADRSFGQAEAVVEVGAAEEVVAGDGVAAFPVVEEVSGAAAQEAVGEMKTKEFVEALDEKAIAQAIGEAEKRTSGEIRVFVSESLVQDAVKEAEKQFVTLGMTKTKQRNGVLLYFAPKSQKFAVVGDSGVHDRCGQNFWQHVTDEMTPLLKAGKFTDAILLAVREIGDVLAREFACEADDKNELPNQIARDKQ